MDSLARFLGEVKDRGEATDSFRATFGALQLMADNSLKESEVEGLEVWKIDAVVTQAKEKYMGRMTDNENGPSWPQVDLQRIDRGLGRGYWSSICPSLRCTLCASR